MTLQRKRPVQRAHTGLVGMPYELEPVAPAPAATPEVSAPPAIVEITPAPKKRGRPPKGDNTMTPVERKTKQRAGETIAQVLKENHDSKGRLHGERSEGDRKFGMSEIERIIAAQERDEHGKRVKPTGHAPGNYEAKDTTADSADATRSYTPNKKTWTEAKEAELEKITKMAVWAFNDTTSCRLCGFTANSAEQAIQHIEDAWDSGLKLQEHLDKLLAINEDMPIPADFLGQARKKVVDDKHFSALVITRNERKRIIS